jgi:hypothetical protein
MKLLQYITWEVMKNFLANKHNRVYLISDPSFWLWPYSRKFSSTKIKHNNESICGA